MSDIKDTKPSVFSQAKGNVDKIKQQIADKKAKVKAQEAHIEEASIKDEDLSGRMLFEKLYDNRQNQMRFMLYTILVLSVYAIGSLFAMYHLAYSAKVIVEIVRVDGNNQIINISQAKTTDYTSMKPYFATYMLQDFIQYTRGVPSDAFQEKSNLNHAYAVTTGDAAPFLKDFILKRQPYAIADKQGETIGIEINNTIPNLNGEPNATQITWTEVARVGNTGEVISTKQYRGIFNFKWDAPANKSAVVQFNPLGFYITNISWSQVYQG